MKSKKLLPLLLLTLILIPTASALEIPQDLYFEIAKGNIKGHSAFYFSAYDAVVGTTRYMVWSENALYVYPTTAIQMNVSSSSIQDNPAGTGAYNVTIYGLDANYNQINETVTMNGRTAVPTVNNYFRINKMNVNYAGAAQTNVGRIYLGTGTPVAGVPPVKYCTIQADYGESSTGTYTVPAGKTAFIVYFYVSTDSSKIIDFSMETRCLDTLNSQAWRVVYHDRVSDRGQSHDLRMPFQVTQTCDVKYTALNTVGDAYCNLEAFIIVVDNDYINQNNVIWADGTTSVDTSSGANTALILILAVMLPVIALIMVKKR